MVSIDAASDLDNSVDEMVEEPEPPVIKEEEHEPPVKKDDEE